MNLICGKCNTEQEMEQIFYGNKEDEFSWWCNNCEDRIAQSSVRLTGEESK